MDNTEFWRLVDSKKLSVNFKPIDGKTIITVLGPNISIYCMGPSSLGALLNLIQVINQEYSGAFPEYKVYPNPE